MARFTQHYHLLVDFKFNILESFIFDELNFVDRKQNLHFNGYQILGFCKMISRKLMFVDVTGPHNLRNL